MSKELIILSITGKLPCIFHELTGLYCPGCGGTRALKALLRGDVVLSFLYHPLVLYCVFVAAIFFVSYMIYWKTKKPQFHLYLDNNWIYGGLIILIVNFLVKNYLLIVKGIDILALLGELA